MPVRIYRITGGNTVTAVGVGTTQVVAKGRIRQVSLIQNGQGGAGEGRLSVEVALNNTANGNAETASGAPSELLVARSSCQFGNATNANLSTTIPCDIPVIPGNLLCLNYLGVGTAPARAFCGADIHVME